MKKSSKSKNKVNLILALKDLLRNQSIGTQEDIVDELQKQGFAINQVKISRLLHKLGALKMNVSNKIVYRLPLAELVTIAPRDPLKQLILNIDHNGYLIVIQTAPGSAQLVARVLDQKNVQGILGTVAGDDTIFIAPKEPKQIQMLFSKVSDLFC